MPFILKSQIFLYAYRNVLQKVSFFNNRPIGLLMKIVPHLKPIIFAKNDIIYDVGDYAEEIFFLSTGEVEIITTRPNVYSYYIGEYFGEKEILEKKFRSERAICKSESCLLFELPKNYLFEMLEKYEFINTEV